jgi:dehydrogenase/reductase SDR family protein 7B
MSQTIWITGASSGIGKELALAYMRRGDRVILSARNEQALQAVAASCPENAPRPLVLPLDLATFDSAPRWVEEAWQWSQGVDVMIHNAGIAVRDTALDTSLKVDQQLMQVNYFGPVAITKALLPRMLERGNGQFVVVSSLSGKFGVPRLAAYSATKHALHGFFDSLRAELRDDPIHISILVPGIIKTPITVNALKGDGSLHGKMDKVQSTGISAEACAKRMIPKIDSKKEEAYIGGKEGFTLWLNRFFPGLQRRLIRNNPVKKFRQLQQIWKRKSKVKAPVE